MADTERKYWVVEFEDGVQVIPLNWFSNLNKTEAYWPNLKNFKAYDQAVEKMQDIDYDNWTEVPVKTILGSSDSFQKARSKLREAERVTDINSDQELDYLKKRRRVRAAKTYDDQNTPPSACKVSQLEKFPAQPTKRVHQPVPTDYSQSQPPKKVVRKKSMQSTSNTISNSLRTTKTSENIQLSKSQLGGINDVTSNKESSPRNHARTRPMNMLESEDMFGSDETLFESEDMFQSQNIIESQDEPFQRTQNSIFKTPKNYQKNSELMMPDMANNSERCPPDCTQCKLHSKSNLSSQNVTNETNLFQKFVVRSLIEMKHKLNMLLQNDNEIFNRLTTCEKLEGSNCHISEETKDKMKNIILHLPLKNQTELNSSEKTLTDKDNFSLMVLELKKIGGQNIKAAVYNLMKRVFSNDVAQQFSWFGKKKKLIFSELKICRVILDSVQSHYPNVTDSAIADPIKDWLRHAPERKKKEVHNDFTMENSDESEQ